MVELHTKLIYSLAQGTKIFRGDKIKLSSLDIQLQQVDFSCADFLHNHRQGHYIYNNRIPLEMRMLTDRSGNMCLVGRKKELDRAGCHSDSKRVDDESLRGVGCSRGQGSRRRIEAVNAATVTAHQ